MVYFRHDLNSLILKRGTHFAACMIFSLFKEKTAQVSEKLKEVQAGTAKEYKEPVLRYNENLTKRQRIAGEYSCVAISNHLIFQSYSRVVSFLNLLMTSVCCN